MANTHRSRRLPLVRRASSSASLPALGDRTFQLAHTHWWPKQRLRQQQQWLSRPPSPSSDAGRVDAELSLRLFRHHHHHHFRVASTLRHRQWWPIQTIQLRPPPDDDEDEGESRLVPSSFQAAAQAGLHARDVWRIRRKVCIGPLSQLFPAPLGTEFCPSEARGATSRPAVDDEPTTIAWP